MPRMAARASRKVAVRVDVDHLLPFLVAQLHEQIVAVDPGVGDENIELPHGLLRLGDQRLDRIPIGKIAGEHMDTVHEVDREGIERLPPGTGHRTTAPWLWSARAIAPPMPPVAPVTRARLPVRSNMAASPASGLLDRDGPERQVEFRSGTHLQIALNRVRDSRH